MIIQSFFAPDSAAGNDLTVDVAVQPGIWALILGIRFEVNAAGGLALHPEYQILESNDYAAVGFMAMSGLSRICVLNTCCAFLGAGHITPMIANNTAGVANTSVVTYPNNVLDETVHTLPLPRIPLDQNFRVKCTAPDLGAGDSVSSARVVVAFGTLEEILTMF